MRRLLAVILVILLSLGGSLPASARVASMSVVKEKELGREAYKQVTSQLPVVDDPDSVEYIRSLGARLANQIEERRFEYIFNLIASSEVNAFAIPGGYIFVFAGLVIEFDNEAQLASVVAHEIGHVRERHIASRIDRSKPTNIATLAGMIAGILLGALAGAPQLGQALTLGTVAGGIQQQLAFSREDEEQADYVGYKLMTGLGYDPEQMIEGFKKVYRLETMMAPQVATYLRTHPQSPARMDAVANLIRRNHPRIIPHSNADFLRIKTRLIALYSPVRQAEDDFIRQESQHPKDPMPHYGMALVMMRQFNYPKALQELEAMGPETAADPYFLRERPPATRAWAGWTRPSPCSSGCCTSGPRTGPRSRSWARFTWAETTWPGPNPSTGAWWTWMTATTRPNTSLAWPWAATAAPAWPPTTWAPPSSCATTSAWPATTWKRPRLRELSAKQMDNAADMIKELDKPEKKPNQD